MQLTHEHREIQKTLKRFIDEEINPHVDEWEAAEIVLLLGSESFCLTQSKSLSPYDGFQALSVLGPSTPTPLAHL